MNSILTAGMYTSLMNDNRTGAMGYAMLKDLNNQSNPSNNYERGQYKFKSVIDDTKEPRIKQTRIYNIPEDSKRCSKITKQGEQCKCSRLKESDYCVIHKPKEIKDPPVVEAKPIPKTWKNLYGLLSKRQ